MGNTTTEIGDGVPIRCFSAIAVIDDTVIAILLVPQPSIVRPVCDQRVLLAVLVRRTVSVETIRAVGVAVREPSVPEANILGFLAAAEVLCFEDDGPLDGFVDVVVGEGGAAAGHGGV
jgi:hypothetical protein